VLRGESGKVVEIKILSDRAGSLHETVTLQ